ncbi:MAG: hypothetical protein AAF570_12410, partial [Bacteroidota bacterium]
MRRITRISLLLATLIVLGFGYGVQKLNAQAANIARIEPLPNDYKSGDTITVFGTDLLTSAGPTADAVRFIGSTTYVFDYLDVYSRGTNPNTLEDSIRIIIPIYMDCELSYTVQCERDSGGAMSIDNFGPVAIRDSAEVVYPNGGVYCLGDNNPTPNNLFEPTIVQLDSPGAPNPVLFNNGELAIHSGVIGTFKLRALNYSPFSSTACADTSYYYVTIGNGTVANLDYNGGVAYCPSAGIAAPTTVTPSGGTFTAVPNNVTWTDSTLGIVNLLLTPPGQYSIIYDPPAAACTQPDTAVLNIQAPSVTYFDYDTLYCENDTSRLPFVSTTTAGSFSAFCYTNPTNVMAIDAGTGEIDVVNTPTGRYEITFNPTAPTCSLVTVDSVHIYERPNPMFHYNNNDTSCVDDLPFQTTFRSPLVGGRFRDTTGYVDINTMNGDINPGPPSVPGGPYYVFFIIDDPYCPDSVTAPIWIFGKDSADVYYPDSVYCISEPNPTPVFNYGSLGGVFEADPQTSSVDPMTGEINLST